MTYQYFQTLMEQKIKSDDAMYYDLLKTVVQHPERYTGIFRLSNVRTKLIQNITQSREIKFGDFMEAAVTEYIAEMGFENLDKHIGTDDEGNELYADQVFRRDDTVTLMEQKIRDDHDSTKKRGQYENFRKKFLLLQSRYPDCDVRAVMWFIDESLKKNRAYYLAQAAADAHYGVPIAVVYGGPLFDTVFGRPDVWQELCGHLTRNRQERSDELLQVPDFDTSEEMFTALKTLQEQKPRLCKKLCTGGGKYSQLRSELFPTGYNLNRLP